MKRFVVMVAVAALWTAGGTAAAKSVAKVPDVVDAEAFMKGVEAELMSLWIYQSRMDWVRNTYITDDTEALGARANEAVMEFVGRKGAEATRFDAIRARMPAELKRKFDLLKMSLDMPAPRDAGKRAELAGISTSMDSLYGKGRYCSKRQGGKCLNLVEMTELLAKNRDYDDLLDVWQGWHKVSPPMRPSYLRFVELANEGAKDLGFRNLTEVWTSRYDMPPADFQAETDRLFEQLKPLYQDLHCHVRAKLVEKYGADKVPPAGPIPAHLLGNMWAQEWSNLFDMLAPEPGAAGAIDLEAALKTRKTDERAMVRYGEGFFTSLGLPPLPDSFWVRSMFTKPADREVVCHASAWDVDQKDDLRIKMCIQVNEEDFTTIHHELGHNYYQRAYNKLSTLFLNSANDGFHEALGDLIALSVTPKYLKELGLIDREPPESLNPLMKRALDKIAFLPWGLLVDRWRWGVFDGTIAPERYNQAWWDLRLKYQGVAPAVPRSEDDFDPGAKYHIPSNVPYTRYFLAAILQFQFHRAVCRQAGHKGPLHTCSIYGNKEVGARINRMMEMGASRPWPEAMKALTGEERMDATAIIEYFAPLHAWLKERNKDRKCGW
ncbi:MAG: M2 family metallopeptidase [Deltaproteobacteria bacterium]|nr:M2 family metallopeptidase [Deltaproteobacteria bacterium]